MSMRCLRTHPCESAETSSDGLWGSAGLKMPVHVHFFRSFGRRFWPQSRLKTARLT